MRRSFSALVSNFYIACFIKLLIFEYNLFNIITLCTMCLFSMIHIMVILYLNIEHYFDKGLCECKSSLCVGTGHINGNHKSLIEWCVWTPITPYKHSLISNEMVMFPQRYPCRCPTVYQMTGIFETSWSSHSCSFDFIITSWKTWTASVFRHLSRVPCWCITKSYCIS